MNRKDYTVSQFCEMTGLSVRTLRYYDEKGLLKSRRRKDNGYRVYDDEHLMLVRPILLFRELDFSLESIKEIVFSQDINVSDVLKKQKKILLEKQEDIQSKISTIDSTLSDLECGYRNREILFKGFPEDRAQRWKKMMDEHNDVTNNDLKLQHLGKLSEDQANGIQKKSDKLYQAYTQVVSLPINSKEVQNEIRKHYILLNYALYQIEDEFTGISPQGFKIFADEMLSNPVSAEMLEYYKEGMTQHTAEAINYFAEHSLKESEDQLRKMGAENKHLDHI